MRNIVFIGLVSFFTDLSTEMVYPLVPLYLTAVFGAGPALVGVIEGIAESLASLLKVFSGYVTDRYKRKKPIAFVGYATSLLYKLALILAGSWAGILAARVTDRFGKGVRTAPRDVLVSESSAEGKLGHSFGLHKALDMAGSAAGILLAFFILKSFQGEMSGDAYKRIFLISCVPALLALAMFFFIKESAGKARAKKTPLNVFSGLKQADGRLKLYLLATFIFTLGNSSNTFLLLRAGTTGYDAATVILLYFLYMIVSSALAIPFGRWSDRIGRKRILVSGYLVFSAVYGLFAWAPNGPTLIAAFALYGFFTAMTAGVERAFIAELSPPELKGTMLGLQSTLVGIALLPASMITGFLWDGLGPEVAFGLGASLSLVAALMLAIGIRTKQGGRAG